MHFSLGLGSEEQQPEVPIFYHDVTSPFAHPDLNDASTLTQRYVFTIYILRLYCI